MNNIIVITLKALLTSACLLTIALSLFLSILVFDMASQDGLPPLLNIKASIAVFVWTMLCFVISLCIKSLLYSAIDSRNLKISIQKIKSRIDDISF